MLGAHERVVFVHAHPDDETIVTGGTIATLLDAGSEVTVVTCTRGERGEVVAGELKHLEGDGPALAAERERELAGAMAALGVTDQRFLGSADARRPGAAPRRYTDSGMRWGPDGFAMPAEDVQPDSLSLAELGEVAADVATVIADVGATAVVSYDFRGGYGHPDHIATREAAAHAAEVLEVPFFEIVEPGTAREDEELVTVDVMPVLHRKRVALEAHRTQLTLVGDTITMSGGQQMPLETVERFRLVRPHDEEDEEQTPAGKVTTGLLAGLLGIVFGTLGTFSHRIVTTIAGVDVPLGLVLSILAVGGLLVALRLLFDSRLFPLIAGAAAVVAVVVLSSVGGETALVPLDAAGILWSIAPIVLTAAVVLWGRRRSDASASAVDPAAAPADAPESSAAGSAVGTSGAEPSGPESSADSAR
ncbi:PIG-L family deacetylase [Herbiconiux sp. SYSU D00978]|uniref:PIG-L family deacetylase n=1 Tax=Herbiconiux sp. SYSU D00978 TaxID=2812562 RepID=UPI001A96D2A0|nr:PIG-L family deacetylase [Herbiconiux sp. SYSU D00978]